MAFWNRKKQQKQTEPLSPAATIAAAAAGLGPAPAAPVAPLRLPTLDSNAPLIAPDALKRGTLTLEQLAFRPVSLPELVHPFVNPKQPDLLGIPNWVFQYFLETLRDASVASVNNFEKLLVVWRGPEHPHVAFIYIEGGAVLPVWFEHDQLVPWLITFGEVLQGPCELEAQLSGYKTRTSAFDNGTDLADFIRTNAPSHEEAVGTASNAGTARTPAAAEAATPSPQSEPPHPSALQPPANLGAGTFIQRDGLEPGTLILDDLDVRRVPLPDLPAPFLDPDRPESFGEPNYAVPTLVEHLRTAMQPVVDNLEVLLIHQQSSEDPPIALAYTRDRTILPVWFDGPLVAWLTALRGTWSRAFDLRIPPSGGHQSGSAMRNPTPDMAAFILASAPAAWRGFDDMPAKQQLLDDALAANSRRADVDAAAVAETWRTLIDVTGAQANDPISDAEVAAFEAATGMTIPPELEAVLRVHNGAAGAFGAMTMMSLSEILLQWQGWKQIFDEWPLIELVDDFSARTQETLTIYTTPLWIPLVDERSGNFAALDLAPGPDGVLGQVIYFGADESHGIRVLATDLGDFLTRQLEYARAEVARHGAFPSQNASCFYLN